MLKVILFVINGRGGGISVGWRVGVSVICLCEMECGDVGKVRMGSIGCL